LVTSAVREGRPRGKRFGSLVHAVLAAVPWSWEISEIRAIAEVQGRLLGAPEREIEAAVLAVEAALRHPLLDLARKAGADCRRECPVAELREDGVLVEGVADLVFREPTGGWTVVDFKTDAELGERIFAYETQIQAYVRAIARATGAPARGVLLSV
jgi:ATP-dependent exoDNAse (exonuclease V) beta subunit